MTNRPTTHPVSEAIASCYWTPHSVAVRAARLFEEAGARTVLDVGSGVGSCVSSAAAAYPGCTFVGIEQRGWLVEAAREASRDVGNVRFVVGDATGETWEAYDGVYMFNPLAENLYPPGADRIDSRVELTPRRFRREKSRVERELRRMRRGSAFVTYCGAAVGLRIPGAFEPRVSEPMNGGCLRLWTKTGPANDEGHYVELQPAGERYLRPRPAPRLGEDPET
jgi:hypothetical protein